MFAGLFRSEDTVLVLFAELVSCPASGSLAHPPAAPAAAGGLACASSAAGRSARKIAGKIVVPCGRVGGRAFIGARVCGCRCRGGIFFWTLWRTPQRTRQRIVGLLFSNN